jgi:RNA polymerase primary sigma factor
MSEDSYSDKDGYSIDEPASYKQGGNGNNGDRCKDLFRLLCEDIEKIPRVYPKETIAIIRDLRKTEKGTKKYCELKNQVVKGNLKLVVYSARKFSNNPSVLLDLFSEGVEGLMIAAERYDPDRNASFGTYAWYWINQRILGFFKENRTIRIPFHFLEKYYKIRTAKRELEQERGAAFAEDIAGITGYDSETVNQVLKIMPNCHSLDYVIDNECSLKDIIEDKTIATPFGIVSENEVKKTIDSLLVSALPFKHREVVKLRFGIDSYEQMTLEHVGQIFNLTRERVRQIEEKSIIELRKKKNIKRLESLIGS